MAKAPARVTLPGDLYQKNGRWWWKVELPGEGKAKARALKPEGSRCATKDRREAEEIARRMWSGAIEAEAEAGLSAKAVGMAQEAIEKAKSEADDVIAAIRAECDKKIKRLERAVARAENKAKVQEEGRLRAEAGYTAQMQEAEERYTEDIAKIKQTIEQAKAELIEKDKAYKEALTEAEQKVKTEISARQEAESRAKEQEKLRVEAEQVAAIEAAAREKAEKKADSETRARAEAEEKLQEVLESTRRTATCECCGREDVPENDLAKIDSGQRLCQDCLKMLRG